MKTMIWTAWIWDCLQGIFQRLAEVRSHMVDITHAPRAEAKSILLDTTAFGWSRIYVKAIVVHRILKDIAVLMHPSLTSFNDGFLSFWKVGLRIHAHRELFTSYVKLGALSKTHPSAATRQGLQLWRKQYLFQIQYHISKSSQPKGSDIAIFQADLGECYWASLHQDRLVSFQGETCVYNKQQASQIPEFLW